MLKLALMLLIVIILVNFFYFPIVDEGIFFNAFGMKSFSLGDEKHPILIYNSEELDAMREKVKKSPYKEWYKNIQRKCEIGVNKEEFKNKREEAYYSKVLAFCYAMESKEEYGKKAESLLQRANKGKFENLVSNYNDGLIFYSQAYDMLKGENWNFEREEEIRDGLKELMVKRGKIESIIVEYPFEILGILSFDNNQEIRKSSAIGIAAIALANESESKEAFKNSLYSIARVYTIQSNSVPTWGEGPNYFNYAMRALLPFLRAVKNYEGVNLMEKMDKNFEWAYNLTTNTGELPNYDDGEFSYFMWPMVETKNRAKYLYLWENSNIRNYGYNSYWDVDILFSYYNESRKIEFPSLVVMEKTGAVFRGNGLYLLLLAERDESISKSHEHPDGLSIIFQKGEEIIIGDSGYYAENEKGEKQVDKVNKDINHNIILVDGKGESYSLFDPDYWTDLDRNTYIKTSISGKSPFVRAYSNYRGAYVERSVLFFNKEYFVLFDKGISNERKNFSLLFHTISENVKIDKNTAEWKGVLLLSNYNIKSFDQIVSKERKEYIQKTIRIDKKSNSAAFITVVLPYKKPIKTTLDSTEDYSSLILDFGDYRDIIIHNRGEGYEVEGIKGDEEIAVYRVKGNDIISKFSYE